MPGLAPRPSGLPRERQTPPERQPSPLLSRHARACPGQPYTLSGNAAFYDVDCRVKPGNDEFYSRPLSKKVAKTIACGVTPGNDAAEVVTGLYRPSAARRSSRPA